MDISACGIGHAREGVHQLCLIQAFAFAISLLCYVVTVFYIFGTIEYNIDLIASDKFLRLMALHILVYYLAFANK